MRHVGLVAAVLFSFGIACGPDPNAQLPGEPPFVNTGGSSGGPDSGPDLASAGGAGGTTTTPSKGGTSGSDSGAGGVTSAGGTSGGGATGKGGTTSAPLLPEPCSSPKDVSCSNNGINGFGSTTKACFRTMDGFAGWQCGTEGWTLKVNGVETTCGKLPLPPSYKGVYYFDFTGSATAKTWANMSWYGTCKTGTIPPWSTIAAGLSGGAGSGGTSSGGAGGTSGSNGGASGGGAGGSSSGTNKDAATD